MANRTFNPWQQNPFADPYSQQNKHNFLQEQMRQSAERLNYQREQVQHTMNAMTISRQLGSLIMLKRDSLGLSHDDIAAKTGLSPFEIVSIETGSNNEKIENLFKILSALDIQLNAF